MSLKKTALKIQREIEDEKNEIKRIEEYKVLMEKLVKIKADKKKILKSIKSENSDDQCCSCDDDDDLDSPC